MNIGRAIAREITRGAGREWRRVANFHRLQGEAASRPESRAIQTPHGLIWMSPIEYKLYVAMLGRGLSPIPQLCINGYYVDFAFPDVGIAVEADGAAYHDGLRRDRDRKRDWILRRAGWTVKRFHGTTIYHRPENCAYVVWREVETRRMWARERAREEAHRRQMEEARRRAQWDAFLRPFRKLLDYLSGVKPR